MACFSPYRYREEIAGEGPRNIFPALPDFSGSILFRQRLLQLGPGLFFHAAHLHLGQPQDDGYALLGQVPHIPQQDHLAQQRLQPVDGLPQGQGFHQGALLPAVGQDVPQGAVLPREGGVQGIGVPWGLQGLQHLLRLQARFPAQV